MDFEFDKEIDVLLRQTAQGEFAFAAENPKSAHLDTDEISAFVENALPEKSREKYVLHFADCAKCRKNLSNLILLNIETDSEKVHAEEKQIVSMPLPWYRKLFASPNLAYTLGALILVFSGIAAFTILQSVNNTPSFEMSQISETQPNGKGMSSDGDAPVSETYSSNSMMSNSASMNSASNEMMNSSTSAIPSAPVLMANSNVAVRAESDKNLKAEPKIAKSLTETSDSAETENQIVTAAPPPAPKENNFREDEMSGQQQNMAQNSVIQNQTIITPDSLSVQRSPTTTLRAEAKAKKLEESKDDAQRKSAETTTVGGKTFKRQNNVWYDSLYKGQATTNVTRGTKEYKKLDSELRAVAERIGGTVVVVWKEKAYRIQ